MCQAATRDRMSATAASASNGELQQLKEELAQLKSENRRLSFQVLALIRASPCFHCLSRLARTRWTKHASHKSQTAHT
jgi:hypothetical protein